MTNDRNTTECDFCHKDVVTSLYDDKYGKSGVDILRPFNPSFESFLEINPKIPSGIGELEICKLCAEKMANYIENVLKTVEVKRLE